MSRSLVFGDPGLVGGRAGRRVAGEQVGPDGLYRTDQVMGARFGHVHRHDRYRRGFCAPGSPLSCRDQHGELRYLDRVRLTGEVQVDVAKREVVPACCPRVYLHGQHLGPGQA